MIILAIETSCDETAVAVVECPGNFSRPKFKILSNIISSQVKIHAEWGGVVPNLAKREHIKNLPAVLKKALKKADIKPEKTDLIAVTVGPGLEPALWTGINFAEELAKKWNKPIIGINHMEGHILSVLLKEKSNLKSQISKKIEFPAVALLVSGGHTELVLIKNPPAGKSFKYKIIGQTRDDAAGEAFDKVAKMLGLPYPGGPQVAKLAGKIQPGKTPSVKERSGKTLGVEEGWQIKLPRPMLNSKNYDFSFSGLKTAVLYLLRDLEKNYGLRVTDYALRAAICAEFQQAVIDVLISKTIRAAEEYKVKTIILGGGVAANKELRKQLKNRIKEEIPNAKCLMPDAKFTGDNAAMIAVAAYFHAIKKPPDRLGANWKKLKANGNLQL
ncbi:tRNA (adenosine(37)-N6)-threonylcarbamoyltransferase complex transferase subunit TsaD [Patescibacteria group bacterium]|nr:tRNA (adenosine(37)-N6)-threonylcarbamoyltransferase complex transferase subunit TsaD [Patescibacteria group bacterium]MBU4353539.1 tRNA (adenosine(37)-N6)-threonylcarbamoyltransferase complex transferase subunit TsaD [Patescibacteria group bacterium]MBU4476846.1 tRNA (adenosine(37)-N6)-threonylcarbamoyltransferase complex transferase subunit TsaD [Patescibacteria group bacterium]MCG2699280.1 tRNA (adenosine(37)-N6)-threonylcarbamoyltransferase complex transferase subunit TsaD [Candidatus Par